MSGREENLKTMLREVCLRGLSAVAQPRNTATWAEMREACLRGNAYLKSLSAADLADALGPRDPRPPPPLPDVAPAIPEPTPAERFEPRLPYRDD